MYIAIARKRKTFTGTSECILKDLYYNYDITGINIASRISSRYKNLMLQYNNKQPTSTLLALDDTVIVSSRSNVWRCAIRRV